MILIHQSAHCADRLVIDGVTLAVGDAIAVPDPRGRQLSDELGPQVKQADIADLTAEQLARLAAQVGVKAPEKHRSRRALSDAIAKTLTA